MKNYFETNILPLSEDLQNILDAQELRDDKDRADAQAEVDQSIALKEEALDCE